MSANSYDYIKSMDQYFAPKTPYAAYKAARKGFIPAEVFIYKTTSIEPVIENPDNLYEIERILAQRDRDIMTNSLLVDILNKLVKNRDKEIALFAAESINAIENEYNRKIEEAADDNFRLKADLYMQMSVINKMTPDLKNFYLQESFGCYREIQKKKELIRKDRLNMARVLLELNLPFQAKVILADAEKGVPEFILMKAEIAFRERDFAEVNRYLGLLEKHREDLDTETLELIDFWKEQ